MEIAVRIEPNSRTYIDKNLRPEIDYTKPPYNFTIITIDDKYSDCEGVDFDGLEFSAEKYNSRKTREIALPRIAELKQNLANTDYIANKLSEAIADALVSGDNTKVYELKTEYAKQLQDRESWRDEIDRLEKN